MVKAELSFTLAIFAMAAIICPARARGQEPNNNQETKAAIVEPEFVNVFYRLDAGKLIPLERQALDKVRARASGFLVAVHGQSVSELAGAKSPVRFGGGKLEFVVRTSATDVDPQTQYSLRMLIEKKKSREMVIATTRVSVFGGVSSSINTEGDLPVTFTRYGNSSVKMTVGSLPPGEYVLSSRPPGENAYYAKVAFCFGIDE